jgi:hypothetical protein
MSYEIPGFTRSYEAAIDLSAKYLCFVKKSGALLVGPAAASDPVVGVLQNKPNKPSTAGVFQGAERTSATVMISGVTRVIVGATAVAAGDLLVIESGTTGKVVPKGTASAGTAVVGQAEEAGAAGAVIAMLLKPLGAVV